MIEQHSLVSSARAGRGLLRWLPGLMAAAAFGLLSPVATAVLHNGTTIAILLASLRQRL